MTAFAALSLPMPLPCEAPPLIMEQLSGSNRSSNNPRKGGIHEFLSKRGLEGTESLARSGWLGLKTASIGNPNSLSVLHALEQSDQIGPQDMILHAPAPQRHPGVSVTHTPDHGRGGARSSNLSLRSSTVTTLPGRKYHLYLFSASTLSKVLLDTCCRPKY